MSKLPQASKLDESNKKLANRAFHRLSSIRHDVDEFVRPLLGKLASHLSSNLNCSLTLVANERCGVWYTIPLLSNLKSLKSCYFKSTDGHVHDFSLKRLNLELLDLFSDSLERNVLVVVDSSVRKPIPDSFSRTIPIWCCVLNRVAQRYRQDRGLAEFQEWDTDLYVPSFCVDENERRNMENIIGEHAETLLECQAIIDVEGFLRRMTKPLAPLWIAPENPDSPVEDVLERLDTLVSRYNCIVCVNTSVQRNPRVQWKGSFWYTPGAADDEESWCHGITPFDFWNEMAKMPTTVDGVDEWLKEKAKLRSVSCSIKSDRSSFDWIKIDSKWLAVGTRRAGRPPDCWDVFDAVLNVTENEYDGMISPPEGKYYLQLPVKEGKRGDLEDWLALGIVFCLRHLCHESKVLVHCAQGRDRSVAVVLSVLLVGTQLRYPLRWSVTEEEVGGLVDNESQGSSKVSSLVGKSSGLRDDAAVDFRGIDGRDRLLEWIENREKDDGIDFSKKFMRIALQLIRQDRNVVNPSRSTMQKLNRFFASRAHEPRYQTMGE